MAFVEDQPAPGHDVVAVGPDAVLLAIAEGGAGRFVVRVELDDPRQVPLGLVAHFVFAAPLDDLPMGLGRVGRRARELLVLEVFGRLLLDDRDLVARERDARAIGKLDDMARRIVLSGIH